MEPIAPPKPPKPGGAASLVGGWPPHQPTSRLRPPHQPGPLPLAYCTDVSSIPPETWPRLRGLRTLVLDLLRPRAHPTHFTVDEAIDAATRIGADQTWFLHMSHEIRHAALDPTLPPRMRLAWDGVRLERAGGPRG